MTAQLSAFIERNVWMLLLAFAFAACQQQGERVIVLENTSGLLRVDQPVILTRIELEEQLTSVPSGMVPVLLSETGDTIPAQVDDLTGDGTWDELFFLYTMNPESSYSIEVVFLDEATAPVFDTRTNIRMAEITEDGQYIETEHAPRLTPEQGQAGGIYHLEGPGWENELVGFRNYLDARNGMDIFGKVTPEMVLDRAGIDEDYHQMQDWGHDILMVGASLGSGALAIEKDGNLHRIAPEAKGSYELLSEGPLRSIFRLRFYEWVIDGTEYNLVQDISIHGGAWYYESKVYFSGLTEDINLVAGITTISLGDKEAQVKENVEGCAAIISTHGQQAYAGENLGMAIMLYQDDFTGTERVGEDAEGINSSVLVKMPVQMDKAIQHRFYACWEVTDNRFADEDYFNNFLEIEAAEMCNPIEVSFR